jgi:predicted metalloprotease with PDZ domain
LSEGFTSYYDNLLTRRAGMMKEADYLEVLRSGIESIHGNPGDAIQSLAESSWDAWIKYYLRNENSSNITVTYYRKGAMMGLVFDLAILQASGGAFGLDSLMKKMYQQYHLGLNRGFSDEELLASCREFMGSEADSIFQKYIYGTERVDFNRYLAFSGLALEDVRDPKAAYLGVGSRNSSNRLMVTSIRSNSAAEKAGLNVNDLILTVDGEEINELDKWLKSKKPGESFIFIVYRDGKKLKLEGKLEGLPAARYSWTKSGKRNPVQQKIYDQIVGKS